MADHDNLRYILKLARACVHKALPHEALEHLRTIRPEIDSLPRTSSWAEHELVYAGTLAAMNDAGAETAFDEALARFASLSEPDPALEMIAHEDYAKYLAGRRALGRAREHYCTAERIADTLSRDECVAHFQMCVIGLDLRMANSLHLHAFQRLQEAAKDGYTEVHQRDAWIAYTEEVEETAVHLVAARKGAEASVDYFRGLLRQIRRNQK